MPLYDFQCTTCQQQFTQRAKYGDLPPCPSCGAKTEKIPAPTAFAIRGANASSATASPAATASSTPATSSGHVHSGNCGCGATSYADSLIKKHLD